MNTTQQVIILSAENNQVSESENKSRTANLNSCLYELGLSVNQATGCFNGTTQDSFVVIVKNEAEIDAVKKLAFNAIGFGGFGQDAILYQDANQEAYLVDKSGDEVRLGRLEQVDKSEINKLENYTIMNGQVYTTVKRAGHTQS